MVGVDAELVTTGVVDVFSLRDRADVMLVCYTMAVLVLTAYVHGTSTFLVDVSNPHPAPRLIVFLDLL
jgi:hypothetical protein